MFVRFELAVTPLAAGLCSHAINYKGALGGAGNGTLPGALFFSV